MAVHGINSGLFEFLLAPDKKTQEFLASLKPGDTLRGKVADIIQGQNKAVINFRGNNVTSLMPQGMDIQKGDIINVTVTKTGDSIFMKLSNNITAEVGRGAPVISAGTAAATPQQIAGMLAAAQAPVNEQNIYIAQKLIDYNLPVDSKNINDINSALVMNMRSKGIEQAVISLSGQDAAKEALASFLARLNTQMAAHASAMKAGASQAEAQSIRQEAAVKALNMLNVINSIAAQAGRAGITVSGQSVTLELLNVQPQLFNAIGAQMQTLENARGRAQNVPAPATQAGGAALNTGQTAANQAQVSLSTGVPAQTAAGMPAQTVAGVPAQTAAGMPAQTAAGMPAQTVAGAPAQTAAGMPGPPPQIAYNAGKMVINFNEIIPAIKTLTAQGVTPEINSLRTVIESGILAPRSANPGNPPAAVSGAQQNTDAGRAINSISEAFEGLKNAVHKPEHTTIRENAVLIAGRINSLANGAAEALKLAGALPKENPVVLTGAANESAKIPSEALLRQELSAIHTAVTAAAKRAGIPADSREIRITAENYSNFRNEAARLVENLSQFKIFNTQKPADAPIRINTGFDAASAIESLVFLKSRSLPLDNSRFVDMMSKYFSNDMKLSQNIEQFSLLASKLPDPKNAAPEAREVFNAVKETAQNITAMAREMAIRPAESNFKQGIIEQQLKGFIEKSGVSIENNIKDALVKPGADNPVFSGLRDSLKAALVKLTNEIENAAKSALPQDAKENILRVRESANDILTNLNALQFINQKPAAFELIYTQLPVFLNNGFLNGEVQIWFRKGGIKENMAAANPINMVFVLNTTNLGAVKVTMTVVKNQVECTVKTENEKAKQALMRGKNEFVSALKKADFDLRVLSINVGGEGEAAEPPAGSGYIDLGRIDIKA